MWNSCSPILLQKNHWWACWATSAQISLACRQNSSFSELCYVWQSLQGSFWIEEPWNHVYFSQSEIWSPCTFCVYLHTTCPDVAKYALFWGLARADPKTLPQLVSFSKHALLCPLETTEGVKGRLEVREAFLVYSVPFYFVHRYKHSIAGDSEHLKTYWEHKSLNIAATPRCIKDRIKCICNDVCNDISSLRPWHAQVVLVNGGTASTAELIAASFQDNNRATLLGEKTFGKGRTQRVIKLRDNGLLLLSNTSYLTPSHKVVDKVRSNRKYSEV